MEKVYDHHQTIKNAKRYCKEDISLIEGYAAMLADSTHRWSCHHRREIDENKSRQQLIDEELYYKRPSSELIFMTESAHAALHNSLRCKDVPLSEEHKQNIKTAMNRTDVIKKMSDIKKGRHWFNNGLKSIMAFKCPPGYGPGRLKR